MRVVGLAFMFAVALGAAACNSAPSPEKPPDYVPGMPFGYDGQYLEGSFEGPQGEGWDTCYTKTAGVTRQKDTGGSNGSSFLVFESSDCSIGCSAGNPSSSQAYLWFSKPTNTSDLVGLYFDAVNMDSAAPTGVLAIYGTDIVCEEETPLVREIHLDELELGTDWNTRCVDLAATGAHAAIGLAVTGGAHRIGIDALRLGPPCHGDDQR